MANSRLLHLVSRSMQAMGVAPFAQPASVIGNTNQDVVQTLALINIEGDAIARGFDWEAMRVQHNFAATFYEYTGDVAVGSANLTNMSSITNLDDTFMVTGEGVPQDTFITGTPAGAVVAMNREGTVAGTTVALTFSKVRFAFPTGFDRSIDRTQWDKSKHWEMLGPSTPQQSEWLRSGFIATGPRIRYWPMGGFFQIWPPLGTTEQLSYEYLSKYWVASTGTSVPTKQSFTVDTDTCIFPDALMYAMIRLKYFEVKAFDTTALFREYQAQLDLAKSGDHGSLTLTMDPQLSDILISWDNIPDSGYGS